MDNGWTQSAEAWITDMGEHGDFGRRYVLDPVMLARARASGASRALDVGCGEGRFCRMLAASGLAVTGLDPTPALIVAARARDRTGHYLRGVAEALPFGDGSFDLVVSYLTLIDIADLDAAVAELARVPAPGGTLLIANLTNFNTPCADRGWVTDGDGRSLHYPVDDYLEERGVWVEWRGIRIVNYHRPMRRYLQALLGAGLQLTWFDEPEPTATAPAERAARYRRVPWFLVMEWRKPAAG
ncbi:MAG: class I SAM-dependent methyltransferase [Dehalococcoidia bacterium]